MLRWCGVGKLSSHVPWRRVASGASVSCPVLSLRLRGEEMAGLRGLQAPCPPVCAGGSRALPETPQIPVEREGFGVWFSRL